jgi:Ohr subfamily peroxiredoxin
MIMPNELIYSAHARAAGGREGHTETHNHVSFDIEMPKIPNGVSRSGATTPEDLFAAAYAACFANALAAAADAGKSNIGDIHVHTTVNLNRETGDGEFALEAAFNVFMQGVDPATADRLIKRAHDICPYSRAIRGNINVAFKAHTS